MLNTGVRKNLCDEIWSSADLYSAYRVVSLEERYCLRDLACEWINTRPLKNKNVLLNCHLTVATLIIIDMLLLAGANVSVTATDSLTVHEHLLPHLTKAKVPFIPWQKVGQHPQFDIICDCGAGLLGHAKPKLGMIELTHCAASIYKDINFPVITIDNSKLKQLETFYGTGDGFVRALRELSGFMQNISRNEIIDNLVNNDFEFYKEDYFLENKVFFADKRIVVFGYGKVGSGIAWALKEAGVKRRNIIVIEPRAEACEKARRKGFYVIPLCASKCEIIKTHLKDAFCVVTATGNENTISKHFAREDFPENVLLANMGTPDEWGEKFSTSCVLNQKKAINFAIDYPTRIIYLDAVWTAYLKATQLLANTSLKQGSNNLPKNIDYSIIAAWKKYYHTDKTKELECFD